MSSDENGGCCSCHADEARAVVDPAYRRALWIVVVLNLGFGVVEAIGGFVARSHALKADSLDFLGDGSITLVTLAALGWASHTRARVALVQGVFLALLGLGVLGTALWRAFHSVPPDAEWMGLLGAAGLAVNVSAALALMRFRGSGDVGARAIWLFSRNDAFANLAVIVAAALVAVFRHPWPDLLVAGIIASLFLHSAFQIIQDARAALKEGSGGQGGI